MVMIVVSDMDLILAVAQHALQQPLTKLRWRGQKHQKGQVMKLPVMAELGSEPQQRGS